MSNCQHLFWFFSQTVNRLLTIKVILKLQGFRSRPPTWDKTIQLHCPEAKALSVNQTTGLLMAGCLVWQENRWGDVRTCYQSPVVCFWSHKNIREIVNEPLDRRQTQAGSSISLGSDHNPSRSEVSFLLFVSLLVFLPVIFSVCLPLSAFFLSLRLHDLVSHSAADIRGSHINQCNQGWQ